MAVNIVRKTSETPNISVADDTRMCRYAFGNQNGYIIGKGNELGYEVDGTNFTIKSGEFVVQGHQCAIDAEGVTVTVDSLLLSRNYSIYAKVNLATETVTVHKHYALIGYPTLPESDDFTALTTGSAYVELYRFDVMSDEISGVEKRIAALEYYAKPTGTYPDMTVGAALNGVLTKTIDNFDLIAYLTNPLTIEHPSGKTYQDIIGAAYVSDSSSTGFWYGSGLAVSGSPSGTSGVFSVLYIIKVGSPTDSIFTTLTVNETGLRVFNFVWSAFEGRYGTLTLFYK